LKQNGEKAKITQKSAVPADFLFSNFDLSVGYYVTFLSAATGK
jgi:hypothetical protein